MEEKLKFLSAIDTDEAQVMKIGVYNADDKMTSSFFKIET